MNDVEVFVLTEDEEHVPYYASEEAAGADVKARIEESIELMPGESVMVPTGLQCEIPTGYEIQVRPRSGLAAKQGVTVLNTPGTIDSDYRGPINVILINHGKKPFVITNGMRIAQIVVAPVVQARFVQVESLETTARGAGGFGHTGL